MDPNSLLALKNIISPDVTIFMTAERWWRTAGSTQRKYL